MESPGKSQSLVVVPKRKGGGMGEGWEKMQLLQRLFFFAFLFFDFCVFLLLLRSHNVVVVFFTFPEDPLRRWWRKNIWKKSHVQISLSFFRYTKDDRIIKVKMKNNRDETEGEEGYPGGISGEASLSLPLLEEEVEIRPMPVLSYS